MSEPFLILHKVRGAPAFDIAEQMEVNDEVWWIIPTSGHRAYPYQHWTVSNLAVGGAHITHMADTPPDHWPDHYAASEKRSRLATAAGDLLSLIGLKPKAPAAPVKRRMIP